MAWTLTLHLAADRFDLLLLDIVPPDGSGMELLAELRARGLALPIMMQMHGRLLPPTCDKAWAAFGTCWRSR